MFLLQYCLNKENPKGLQTAIKCIISRAFGEHENCHISWCCFKEDPISYKHRDLPHGKDLFGLELRKSLENLFNEYCTDAVVKKLAPVTNSQENPQNPLLRWK